MAPPAATRRTVDFAGRPVTLSVFERRGGPHLALFVHGLGCAKESFAEAWRAPALDRFQLLAPDLPGSGASPVPAGFDGRMESFAAILQGLLAGFAFERLHVVAHSMGGAPALLATADDPRLATFVNVEGNLVAEDCGMLSRRAAETPFEDFARGKFARMVAAAAEADEADRRLWAGWAALADPRVFHAACRSLVQWSDSGRLLERFLGLTARKLYVCGARSANEAVLSRLGGVAVRRVARCGHFAMAEDADAFYGIVGEALRGS